MSLFNGRDLEGWVVTGCKAGVEDGLLVLQEGDGLVRSEHDYGDFVLELEWRARKDAAWDSGVYFRAEPPAAGKPWPSRYQANLEQGKEGNVKNLAGAESSGLAKAGQWNQLRLKVVGSRAELAINGRPAWKVDGVKPARGYIGFQAEIAKGGQFEFRNINITELDHKPLFNGRDLTGWEGAGQDASACWKVEDQTLLCTGQRGPWLRSKSQYGDFNLRLEYKLKPGGNSGVYVRVPEDGNHRGKELSGGKPSGIEVQILDDGAERYRDLKDYQFCGSLYAISAASPHVGRSAGHWNSMEIDCRGDHYRVIHNGVLVVDATSESAPELARRELRGFLGLQNHSEEVWFRNIRVAETGEQDAMRELQAQAIAQDRASWGHWGLDAGKYTGWKTHSNRLIPIYTFGLSLARMTGEHSPYRDAERIAQLYGRLPEGTLNPKADYFDQTGVYELQKAAVAAGKKYVILMVFDGTDWQTTWAAATYRKGAVGYREGRGTGLAFQDYRGVDTDFGYFVTSPHNEGTTYDPNAQRVISVGGLIPGGYDWRLAGLNPWTPGADLAYTIAKSELRRQAFTDSASSATSMTSGIKTYNDAINVDHLGKPVPPIARELQPQGFSIGVVTSVPISHATPAAAYANNVSRDDYQDLTRDLLGLPSIAHPGEPLPGVDVLIGAGWGQNIKTDRGQGDNFVPGNRYLTADDLKQIDARHGGKYQLAERTPNKKGADVLKKAAKQAIEHKRRLFGYFGVAGGHLPFRTADGGYNPAPGVGLKTEVYQPADIAENPTLAQMSTAALGVLAENPAGFWLMIEAGDVDWANHDDNLDNSIGAVISGDDAFRAVTEWIEARHCWDQTAVILTADHGHLLVLDHPETVAEAARAAGAPSP